MNKIAAIILASTLSAPAAFAGNTDAAAEKPRREAPATIDPAAQAIRRFNERSRNLAADTPEEFRASLRLLAAETREFVLLYPSHPRCEWMYGNYLGMLDPAGYSEEEQDALLEALRGEMAGTPAESITHIWKARSATRGASTPYYAELEKLAEELHDDPHVLGAMGNRVLGLELDEAEKRAKVEALLKKENLFEGVRAKLEGWAYASGQVGQPVSFQFVDIEGRAIDTADWKGKVILVDFWATWCGSCVAEMPRLKKLYDERHAEGLEIVGVSCDRNVAAVKKFLGKRDFPWTQWPPEEGQRWHPQAKKWGVSAIPTLFLIDKKGILRSVDVRSDMEELIPALLAEEVE